MMTIVFQKMEAYSGNFGVDIQTIQKSLDAKFNSRKSQASKLQKDFGVTDLAVSSFFNEEDSLEKSRDEPERVGTQINFSAMDQYLYMLCQNMVDNVCIYQERVTTIKREIEININSDSKESREKVEQNVEELNEKLENLSLRIVPKNQRKSKANHVTVEVPNEKGII